MSMKYLNDIIGNRTRDLPVCRAVNKPTASFRLQARNNSETSERIIIMQCVRKVAVHLQKVLEVMSTSVYTGLTRLILFANTFCSSSFGKSLCTYKRRWKWCPRNIVSKNLIKQLHTLPVLHFNRSLTTEYRETAAHFNDNFDTDNQIYVL
jgi:protein gp37